MLVEARLPVKMMAAGAHYICTGTVERLSGDVGKDVENPRGCRRSL